MLDLPLYDEYFLIGEPDGSAETNALDNKSPWNVWNSATGKYVPKQETMIKEVD